MVSRNLLTVLFFVLSLYCFGAGFVEGFQYSSWSLIPPASFPAVHHAVELQIQRYYVPFLFLSVPVTVLLIWFHHPGMSRNLIIVAALLQTYIVASTVAYAVPIQRQLNAAYSQPLLDKLIFYHSYFRMIPGIAHLLIVVVLLYQVIRTA